MPIEVGVHLRTVKRGPRSTWSGQAFPLGDELLPIESGSQYTLRLPSGNEGTLLVRNVATNWRVGGPTRQRVDVVGSGSAPF